MYDKIYCINLDRRMDRWVEFKRDVLEGMDLDKDKFERISAIDTAQLSTRNPGAIGAAVSHLKAWKDMIECGYDSVLVFEDDFMPTVSKEEFHETIKELYREHPDFTIGCLQWEFGGHSTVLNKSQRWMFANNIIMMGGYIITKTQAILMYNEISKCAINLIHGEPLEHNAIDMAWRKFQSHDFIVSIEPTGIQRPETKTDIQIQPYIKGL